MSNYSLSLEVMLVAKRHSAVSRLSLVLQQYSKTVILAVLNIQYKENEMNKAELVSAIAAKSAQSQTDTNKFVDGFCEAVMEALANGEQVALVGFGTFKVGE